MLYTTPPTSTDTHPMTLALALGHRMPIKLQTPVEAADVHAARIAPVILQRCVVDYIDHRTDDGRRVACNAVEQRFQPACAEGNVFIFFWKYTPNKCDMIKRYSIIVGTYAMLCAAFQPSPELYINLYFPTKSSSFATDK